MRLSPGTVIDMLDGSSVTVQKFLGDGGQGEVYRVVRSHDNAVKALKWYTDRKLISNVQFRAAINRNSNSRPPSPAFLWPEGITRVQHGSFGYIMRLRPPGFYDLGNFFCIDRYPDAYFRSFMAKTTAALRISDSFSMLHRAGLSYHDINEGNFLINPSTGDVLICDTDNITPDGYCHVAVSKTRYRAPEVAEGKTSDRASDRLSLAIILYRIFMVDHPFEGRNTARERYRCLTPESENYLYGRGAVFCYDLDNPVNRPVADLHPNSMMFWPLLPKALADAFCYSLSRESIHNPDERMRASVWKSVLMRVRGNLLTCNASPADGLHDFLAGEQVPSVCPLCGGRIPGFATLHFSNINRYRLSEGKELFIGDAFEPCGVATTVGIYGGRRALALRNTTSVPWRAVARSGAMFSVAPDAICRLMDGMTIHFSPDASARVTI